MKKTMCFLVISLFLISTCKKDDDVKTNYSILSEEDLTSITDGATSLSSILQEEMFSYISIAADSGKYISYPSMTSDKSTGMKSGLKATTDNWSGPDANGWYTCTWDGVYKYTQRIRCSDTIVDYELTISYDGADGSYESKNTTQYVKYTKDHKVMYKGFWDWTIATSGYNEISDVHWKMAFEDWDPMTGAGAFDWYWGASSNGGDDVPFYRYLNIVATDAGNEWLSVKITFYDGSNEAWSFEYDTPWNPVEMPELHTCGGN